MEFIKMSPLEHLSTKESARLEIMRILLERSSDLTDVTMLITEAKEIESYIFDLKKVEDAQSDV